MALSREVISPSSDSELDEVLRRPLRKLFVITFVSSSVPACMALENVVNEMAKHKDFERVTFICADFERVPEYRTKWNVVSVPTTLLLKNRDIVNRLEGVNPAELTKKIRLLASCFIPPVTIPLGSSNSTDDKATEGDSGADPNERLKKLINRHPIMLFMKGTPSEPRCGFSRSMVTILNEAKVDYDSFDILEDTSVREGLKKYSNWPTYPQLYVKGTLIGGLDIVKDLKESGELMNTLSVA